VIAPSQALGVVPAALRDPLLREYESIVQNFMERRWSPAELSGGRFSEIVYTILDGHAKGTYAGAPAKPANMVDSCKRLEANANVPRSFQILIPRMLPVLYEVRNNRNVGHVGGDVDPNHMDALAVLSMCNWVMAELVRVFHSVSVDDAQTLVDNLVERRVPLVWQDADVKRVLDPKTRLQSQLLLLLASMPGKVPISDLMRWTDYKDAKKKYFTELLRKMHGGRLIELSADNASAQILPPGSVLVEQLIAPKLKKAKK
jgi:hypothetical protein